MALPAWLANENVPAPLVGLLRDRGLVVHSVSELMPAASDRAVLNHARDHGLWPLTFDRDYGELVFSRAVAAPPAIVYLRQSPDSLQSYLHALVGLLDDAALLEGHMVVVSGRGVRRRPLPGP